MAVHTEDQAGSAIERDGYSVVHSVADIDYNLVVNYHSHFDLDDPWGLLTECSRWVVAELHFAAGCCSDRVLF